MNESAETFLFLCPLCHQSSEHGRDKLRSHSSCPYCHANVVLLELNGRSELYSANQAPTGSYDDIFAALARVGSLIVDVFFLPLSLLALLLQPIGTRIRKMEEVYEREGWRGVSRFRLSHFLIACTVIAALAGLVGRRFVYQWETQKRATEFYQSHLELRAQQKDVESAVAALGGRVSWTVPNFPSEFYETDQIRRLYALNSGANVDFHDSLPRVTPLPVRAEARECLHTIVSYPALRSLDAYDTKIDGSLFEDLPGSASLEACGASPPLATQELYRWCSRCPNLERLHLYPFGPADDFVVDDACLEALSQCQSLQSIHLERVDVSARGIAALDDLKTLEHLVLRLAQPLEPDAMSELANLPIRSLDLRGPPLSDRSIEALGESATLKSLDIARGTIDATQLARLKAALRSTQIRMVD